MTSFLRYVPACIIVINCRLNSRVRYDLLSFGVSIRRGVGGGAKYLTLLQEKNKRPMGHKAHQSSSSKLPSPAFLDWHDDSCM